MRFVIYCQSLPVNHWIIHSTDSLKTLINSGTKHHCCVLPTLLLERSVLISNAPTILSNTFYDFKVILNLVSKSSSVPLAEKKPMLPPPYMTVWMVIAVFWTLFIWCETQHFVFQPKSSALLLPDHTFFLLYCKTSGMS